MHKIHRWVLTVGVAVALAFGAVAAPELTASFTRDAHTAQVAAVDPGIVEPPASGSCISGGGTCGNIWP